MRTTLLKFVLLFSLVLLNTSLLTGQIQYNNIRFKQLSIAEGLPHNTINAITQDNHSFTLQMWSFLSKKNRKIMLNTCNHV